MPIGASTPSCRSRERTGFEEIVAGLSEREARYEATRCLSCGNCFECDNCYAACPEQAIVKLGKGRFYRVDYDLCTGCAVVLRAVSVPRDRDGARARARTAADRPMPTSACRARFTVRER